MGRKNLPQNQFLDRPKGGGTRKGQNSSNKEFFEQRNKEPKNKEITGMVKRQRVSWARGTEEKAQSPRVFREGGGTPFTGERQQQTPSHSEEKWGPRK